ncbi:hypothetical protein WS50_09020 [Burkholderia territorii]|uniref:hypothetical protein n=1 Tax=Burkholderia territorii TaxID=1503055 RepID=UPI0007559662|nr:hypothetical protein [Burkholderia territorii]KUZ01951.1 hypothetical protein WS47_03870 [Burkholderia territorii]KUZ21108.1 hypothetical protein WS50_09020 [Burkholderia territorii]
MLDSIPGSDRLRDERVGRGDDAAEITTLAMAIDQRAPAAMAQLNVSRETVRLDPVDLEAMGK